jgi:hypothetical protein
MGLSWINPLFLSGLALLALPVLIHLVQKHDARGTRFPSLMFLRRIPQRQRRRLEIRNRLLLLLRCLLLLLIVLAFARPLFEPAGAAGGLDAGREDSVILLDRSYSMRSADHWPRARAIALRLVEQKRATDRIGVLLFDAETELLSDLTSDADNLRSLLRGTSPGLRTTQFGGAIEQAARILAGGNASRKRILLISDFHAVGMPAIPTIAADIEISALPVDVTRIANASLNGIAIEPSSRDAADEFALAVEVANHGDTPLRQAVTLSIDGREVARRDLQLAPGEVVDERFDRLSASRDLLRGVVSLDDDALALDNRRYFVYARKQQLPLLLLEGRAPRTNQSLYLQGALRQSRNPVFRVERRAMDTLQAADLQGWAAIIVNDAAIPGGEPGRALADYVGAGGALLIASGAASPANWPAGADGFMPGTPGRRIDAARGTAFNITDFDPDHPLAIAFGAGNAFDLSLARVFSYRALQPGPQDRVVARYSDGAVALLERRVGAGRVMLLTTTLDTHWNDLALQPIFLPFVHQGLRYLTAFEAHAHRFEIGGVVDVMRYARSLAGAEAIVAAADDAVLVIESPSARAIRLERQAPLLVLAEPGFYQVHHATPAQVEVTLAANIDARESSQQMLDVDRFVEEIRASAEAPAAGAAVTRRQAAEQERQQRLWYAILAAVLLLALLEAVVANWTGAGRSPRTRAGAG